MIDYRNLHDALAAGGLIPGDIDVGRLVRCPVEGDHNGKKSGAYRVFDDDRPTCPWWNWKAGTSGVWVSTDRLLTDADRNRQRQRFEQARREREIEQAARWYCNRDYLAHLWNDAIPVTADDPVGLYLTRRALTVPKSPALRYVPALAYWHDDGSVTTHPAMLAAVTAPDGELVAIHRTYLTVDGHKAVVPAVKKLTRTAGPLAGAAIRLGDPVPRPDGRLALGVAEGIETALAAAILSGIRTWPCVSAHGLAAFVPPARVSSVYVFADHDANGVGQKAAADLTKRLARAGVMVRVIAPEAVGDWNDELMARRAAV